MLRQGYCFCIIIFAFISPFSSTVTQAQEINVNEIINQATLNNQKNALADYSYQVEFVRCIKHGERERKSTKLYEAVLPSRFSSQRPLVHPLLMIAENGKEVPAFKQTAMRQRLVETIERAETEADKDSIQQNVPQNFDGGYLTFSVGRSFVGAQGIRVNLLEILQKSIFDKPKREIVGGRKTLLLRFQPQSNTLFVSSISYLSKIEGMIWIDEDDKRIVRLEAFPLGTLVQEMIKNDSERQIGAVFLYAQTRAPEGYWLPHQVRLNFINHPEIWSGEAVMVEFNFSKYARFRVESGKALVTNPNGLVQ